MTGKGWFASLVACCLLAALSVSASAGVLYVKSDGNDRNGGAAWEQAKQTIVGAIKAARRGDEIWVAAGSYNGPIVLKDGTGLYGGFAGSETSIDQRDLSANKTVIDGKQMGSVVTVPAGATALIDGFTITNGTGTQVYVQMHDWDFLLGGGIYCAPKSSATISHNLITKCSANYGAGICFDHAPGTAVENEISENSANNGGGIYCLNAAAFISKNYVWNNSATNKGGGINCEESAASIVSNKICANKSPLGAGVRFHGHPSPEVIGNLIDENKAEGFIDGEAGHGGGILGLSANATISGNVITRNTSESFGGGIDNIRSRSVMTNNTLARNKASMGGAISSDLYLKVYNSIAVLNSSGLFGANLQLQDLRNNIIYGNGGADYIGVTPGKTDIHADPLFRSEAEGDFRLAPGSPAINAGDSKVEGLTQFDYSGDPRIQGTSVDIGAHESAD